MGPASVASGRRRAAGGRSPVCRPFRWARLAGGVWLILAGLTVGGCEVSKNAVSAPSDAVLSLSAAHSFLPINTATTLTVAASRLDGTALADGTEVLLSASAGELEQRKVRLSQGRASVSYRSGSESGMVRLQASSGGITTELSLRVGSAPPAAIGLSAPQTVLPAQGGNVEIVAQVSAAGGSTVTGAPVTFETSAGTLSPADAVVSDSGGLARVTLRTTATARVRARVEGIVSNELTIRVRQVISLTLSAAPTNSLVGQPVTFTVAARTGGGDAATGQLRFQFGDGQAATLGQVSGSATTSYTYTTAGGFNATAIFTDADAFETRSTIRINVTSPAAPTPTPTPAPTPGPGPTPSPVPPPSTRDDIDPRQVTWLHTDVSAWPQTSTITDVRISRTDICVDHTKAGQFPTSTFGTITVEGNVWIFAQFNGRWYAGTYDWLRPGQVCKSVTADELGRDQIRIPPMDASWTPRSGDLVGFMVSTRARDGVPAGQERTNIVLVRWP